MEIAVSPAEKQHAGEMLQVYNSFAGQFVGSAMRTMKYFRRLLRSKENMCWIAVGNRGEVVGYVRARLDKRFNRGEFREVVVDPKYDFEQVGKVLVEKVHSDFLKRKVSAISAGSIRNPAYGKLFSALGFFESESTDVFMYAILNVQKFLNEIAQVFALRLKQLQSWNGLMQVECEGHSLFLKKNKDNVEQLVWTNQSVNFKVRLSRTVLTKLIFGVADAVECLKNGQIEVELTQSRVKADVVLRRLFPKIQFLIMDHW